MRLLHISDLHIGKHVNDFPLIEDQRFMLDRIVEMIGSYNVDALLIAGDIYDKSSPSAEAVACVDAFLAAVADTGAACFAIAGNHDSAERIAYGSRLFAKQNVFVSPLYDGAIARHTLRDEYGPVDFWLFPFLKPAHVKPYFPDAEIGSDYTAAMRAVVDSCPIDRTRRNVAVAHQFVTACGIDPQRSDSELSLGGLDNVDVSVFDPFDYVALGHIHGPQRIGRDTARYSGSLLKYSASEIRQTKSATLVVLEEKNAAIGIESIPLVARRDMRCIRGPLASLVSDEVKDALSKRERDDYIHAVLTDEFTPIDALAQLRAVYPNTMSIAYDRTGVEARADVDECLPAVEERIDLAQAFARFYEQRNGSALTEGQRALIARLIEEGAYSR
ncbi:MAG: exonuclease SbcCD subunit D [Slackia sp.]|nr:exonuclease SbcCD subunit D [Slackia sp.]